MSISVMQIFRALIPGRGAIKIARTEAEKTKCSRLKKDKAGLSVLWRWSFVTKVRGKWHGMAWCRWRWSWSHNAEQGEVFFEMRHTRLLSFSSVRGGEGRERKGREGLTLSR